MIAGSYILVVIGILIAKCLGFIRDIVFASTFGASVYTDIYFQVFGLASLIFTGIGGALSTLIIKNLNKPENCGEENQRRYVSHFITKTTLIMLGVTAILYVIAESIINLLLPGLDRDFMPMAMKMIYIMLPSCLFVTVAYVIAGILQNCKVFFITSIMSMPYNVLIIASLFIENISILTVSVITTIGWFLHIIILLPNFYRKGYRLFGSLKSAMSKDGKNTEVLFIFIGSMMFQLCFMTDKAYMSFDSGMASTINYASNLFVTISSVFVVAMSNVSYPSLCRNYENRNGDVVKNMLGYIITVLLAIFVPFILTANLFGRDIISLLYERGEFDAELTSVTASLFSIYTFGIFGYVCQELFNKVLYLGSKYIYPVIGTITVVILKPLINALLPDGNASLVAFSTTLLFTLYAIGVLISMVKVVGNYITRQLIFNILKIMLSALCALGVYFIMSMSSFGFIINLAACGITYIAVLFVSGCGKYILQKDNIQISEEI